MRKSALGLALALTFALAALPAAGAVSTVAAASSSPTTFNGVGQLPAMGWDDWNSFSCDNDAADVEANAQFIHDSGLQADGYQYVINDGCWNDLVGTDPTTSSGGTLPAQPDPGGGSQTSLPMTTEELACGVSTSGPNAGRGTGNAGSLTVNVTNATWSNGTATLTLQTPSSISSTIKGVYPAVAGTSVTISGVSPSGYNGTYTVASASTTSSAETLTYSLASNPGTFSTTGTANYSDGSVPAGQLFINPYLFPPSTACANDGFKIVASFVHSLGLKFGLWLDTSNNWNGEEIPGTFGPCAAPGGNCYDPNDQTNDLTTYDDEDAQTFAYWGVNYVKADWVGGTTAPPLNDTSGGPTIVDPVNSPGSSVTNASWSSGTATVSFTPALSTAPAIGSAIKVAGISPSGYNGTEIVTASTTSSISYAVASNPGTFSSSGSASATMQFTFASQPQFTTSPYNFNANSQQMHEGIAQTMYGALSASIVNASSIYNDPILLNECVHDSQALAQTWGAGWQFTQPNGTTAEGGGNSWKSDLNIGNSFSSLISMVEDVDQYSAYAGPSGAGNSSNDNQYGFNDPDMVESGVNANGSGGASGGMTTSQDQAEMSVFAEMASPLILGANMAPAADVSAADSRTGVDSELAAASSAQDSYDLSLFGNSRLIAIDQDSLGKQGTVVSSGGTTAAPLLIFAKPLSNGDVSVLLFNGTTSPQIMTTSASAAGLPSESSYSMTNVWTGQVTSSDGAISANVPAQSAVMFRVSPSAPPSGTPDSTVFSASSSSASVNVGSTDTITDTLTNNGPDTLGSVSLGVTVPSGWTATPGTPPSSSLSSGGTATETFTLSGPGATAPITTEDIKPTYSYTDPGGGESGSTDIYLPYYNPTSSPYLTTDQTSPPPAAVFGQLQNAFAIQAAGTGVTVAAGRSAASNQYAAIYQAGAASPGSNSIYTIQVTAVGSASAAQAGLIIRNSMTSGGEGAVLYLNGAGKIVLAWANGSSNVTSSSTSSASPGTGVWLQLRNPSTNSYTGWYSTSGPTGPWTQVGTGATTTGASSTQDIGLFASSGSAGTLAEADFNGPSDTLTYTGPTTISQGSNVTLSASLKDAATGGAITGQPLTITLAPNSGSPQSCVTSATDSNGNASCTINDVSVDDGSRDARVNFAGGGFYPANQSDTSITVNPLLQDTLTYTGDTSMTDGTSANLSATLVDSNSQQGLSGRTITFTLAPAYNAQQCSGVTNSSGVASCSISSVNEPAGTRTVHVAFGGDTYAPNSADAQVSVSSGPQDNLTYTGGSTFTDGSAGTLSATLTDASNNQPIAGQTIDLTLAPSGADQDCTAVTNSSGVASCTISNVQAAPGQRTVIATFGGGAGYPANQVTTTVTVNGGAADTLTYQGDTTFTNGTTGHLSALLTDSSNGDPIVGQTLTLALAPAGNNQDCQAVTNSSGVASCQIPSVQESSGSHIVRVTFAGGGGYPANQLDTPVTVN